MKHYAIDPGHKDQHPLFLLSVYVYYHHKEEIIQWCWDNGAKKAYPIDPIDPKHHSVKMLVDGSYVDFYDKEMYTMFKLGWG